MEIAEAINLMKLGYSVEEIEAARQAEGAEPAPAEPETVYKHEEGPAEPDPKPAEPEPAETVTSTEADALRAEIDNLKRQLQEHNRRTPASDPGKNDDVNIDDIMQSMLDRTI